ERVRGLAAVLRSRLHALDGVVVVDQGQTQCAIVTFVVDCVPAMEIKTSLQLRRVNVSVSAGSGNLVSYDRRGLTQTVRASLHYFNTETEIERFIEVLEEIVH
ncbi:MAG: cysteine desulfurase/selenocysteine lyase, partial [Gammaproteobacteria bacterium]